MPTKCDVCERDAQFMCSACGNQRYCSVECQRTSWPTHQRQCRPVPAEANQEESEEVELESVRYYIEQLYFIMQPVMLCIALSVLWVKLANPPPLFFATGIEYDRFMIEFL
jgi:hypothetical protein